MGFGETAFFVVVVVTGRQSCYTVDSYSICTMRRCLWPCRLQPMRLGDCGRTVLPSVRSSVAGTARRSITAAGVRPPPPSSPAAQLPLRRRAPPVSSSEAGCGQAAQAASPKAQAAGSGSFPPSLARHCSHQVQILVSSEGDSLIKWGHLGISGMLQGTH